MEVKNIDKEINLKRKMFLSLPKRLKAFSASAHWKLYRRMSFLLSYPDSKTRLEYYRSTDADKNKECTPPKHIHVRLPCFWAAEFYTPAHAQSLLSSFEKLGWTKTENYFNRAELLKEHRMSIGAGGWVNLGALQPRGTKSTHFPDYVENDLPDNVEYATAELFNITSSLACIVVCFIFNEESRSVYEEALRANYRSHIKPRKDGIEILSPDNQKQKKIETIRWGFKRSIGAWFADNLPGVFSYSSDVDELPICEFLLFDNIEAFPEWSRDYRDSGRILNFLRVEYGRNIWKSNCLSGLKFSWSILRDRNEDNYAAITVSSHNISKWDMSYHGKNSLSSYVRKINEDMSEIIMYWGCLGLLRNFERKLRQVRDTHKYNLTKNGLTKSLQEMSKFTYESLDVASFCPELEEFTLFRSVENDLQMSEDIARSEAHINFTEAVQKNIRDRARKLYELDKVVRELVIQQGNIISTLENIELQKSMRIYTLVIGVCALFFAYLAIPSEKVVSLENYFFKIIESMM